MEEVYTSKLQTVDITNAYHFCPVLGSVNTFEREEPLKELNEEKSEEEFLSNKDQHAIKFNRNNGNDNCDNQGCITSIGLFGTHKRKLTASKSQVLKQGQLLLQLPQFWSLKRSNRIQSGYFLQEQGCPTNTSGIRI
jgi:hypothetical protein